MPLLWRVFATNAVVFGAAVLLLALSPATVSSPVTAAEAAVLAAGLAAMLAFDLLLLRRALGPLEVDDMLDRLEAKRRDNARAALAAQEAERARIARELHDEVGQTLTAVMLQLDRAERGSGAAELGEAREAVRGTLEDVRDIARRLRPEALDDLGLPSALAALTNDVSRRTGLRVRRSVTPGLTALSPEEELVVYRVAQEALTNAARHAGAREATLELSSDMLTVADDGRGFDIGAQHGGAGLRGMRERALLVGATLEVRSRPGEGTTVRLRLAP